MASYAPADTSLPWSSTRSDQGCFALVLCGLLLITAIPAILIPGIDLPELPPEERDDVPPQLTRLVQAPKPAEPVELPPPEPVVSPESQPEPASIPETTPTPREQRPQVSGEQTVEQAREVASQSGLLALQQQLAEMRTPVESTGGRLSANVESSGRAEQPAGGEKPAAALTGSGGVTASSGPTREVELASHEVARVAAPVAEPEPVLPAREEVTPQRAMSNIRQVFEAQKTALYSLYRRELRQDPALEGKVLLELIIEPDGRVSHCEVVSSELGRPMLEQRLANRVLLFNFGAKDVERRTVRFPIDFLPS